MKRKMIVVLGAMALADATQGLAASFEVTNGQVNTAVQTLGTGQTGVVDAGGTLSLPSSSSKVAITATGNATIVNSGIITQLGTGRVIRDNTGVALDVTNNAGALMQANDGDVIQMNVSNGSIVFRNAGTLTATNASAGGSQAIDFNAITTGANTLYNYSTGLIQANEADAVRPGVNGAVYNDGIIKSTNNPGSTSGSDGIDAQTNTGIVIVNATTGTAAAAGTGLIEGARHGITGGNTDPTVNNGAYAMSITNNQGGTIRGDNGSGINIDGLNQNEVVTIVNHGTITGNGATGDGDGIDVDGLVNLTNTGTIKSLQAFQDTSEGVTVGGGTIVNSGTIEGDNANGGVGRGITLAGVDKDAAGNPISPQGIYANTTITNSGLIRGQSDSGIAVTGAANGFTVTITNLAGGTIEGGGATAAAIATGANNATIVNYGTITADSSGKAVDLGSGNSSLQILGGSAVVNGDISGGTGTSSLAITPGTGNSFNYAGAISNFANVNIGAGTVTLAGISPYSGPTSIDGGVLAVNGSIAASAVHVGNGGTLAGTGVVGAATVASGGTVSPGGDNAVGTLTANGNVTFAQGARYTVNTAASGTSDLLHATGTAALDGGSVVSLSADGNWNPTTRYTILTADSGVTGTFDTVSSNFAFLTPTLSYTPNNVTLALARNDIRFASFAGSHNQQSTADALDSLDSLGSMGGGSAGSASGGSAIYNAVVQSDAATARSAFDQLSGEAHASLKGAFIGDSQFLADAATDRLRNAFDPGGGSNSPLVALASNGDTALPAPVGSNALWTKAFGTWGHTNGNSDSAGFSDSTGGVFIGADTQVAGNWRVGALGGYSYTSFDSSGRSSSGHSDNFSLGLYAGNQWGPLSLSTGAAYTWHDITTRRSVAFTGFNDTLRSSYDAGTSQVFGELGYSIQAGRFALQPYVNLAYVNVHTDAFDESGGAAALHGDSDNTDTPFSTLGLHVSTDFTIGQIDATARGTLGWRHAWGTVVPTSSLAFAGSDAFTVNGAPISRDAAVIEAGVDFAAAKNVTIGLSYSGQIGNHTQENGAQANLTWKF